MIQRIRRQVSSYKCVAILSYVPLRYEIEPLHFFSNNVHAYIVEPREVLSRPIRVLCAVCAMLKQKIVTDCFITIMFPAHKSCDEFNLQAEALHI